MDPPESLTPPDSVKSEIVSLAPEFTKKCLTAALPLRVRFAAPGPAIVRLPVIGGSGAFNVKKLNGTLKLMVFDPPSALTSIIAARKEHKPSCDSTHRPSPGLMSIEVASLAS